MQTGVGQALDLVDVVGRFQLARAGPLEVVQRAPLSGAALVIQVVAGVDPNMYFRENLLGRETTAEDVADAFIWLARAGATTGCVVTVDGGNAAAFLR